MVRNKKIEDDNCRFCSMPLSGERTSGNKAHRKCYNEFLVVNYQRRKKELDKLNVDELLKEIRYKEIEPLKSPLKEIKNWDMIEREEG